ncbi:MAG: RHS repeat-associated core domain-containing protein [Candidatus Sulfotelmatobacter sp.]
MVHLMIRRFLHGSLVFCVTSFFVPLAAAQEGTINPDVLLTNATQTPVEGVGHDYIHDMSETVNPQNGQVSIRIAGPNPRERGPTFPHYAYMYDSSGREAMTWEPELVQCEQNPPGVGNVMCDAWVVGPGFSPYLLNQFNSGSGMLVPNPTILNTVIGSPVDQSFTNPQIPGGVNGNQGKYTCGYDPYTYYDSHGGLHNLNLHVVVEDNPATDNCSAMGYQTNYFGGDSSIKADFQQPEGVLAATSSGMLITPGVLGTIEDTNGNGENGTGRPMSYTTTTVNGGQGSFIALSTITLPGVSGAYTYQYSNFSRSGTVGVSPTVNPYSTGNACDTNATPTQSASFADVSSLILPNGQSYTFGYDGQWGLVNSIKYPTGGKVTYNWGINSLSESYNAKTPTVWPSGLLVNGPQNCYFEYDLPVVTKRVVSFDGTHSALEQDFAYSTTWGTNGFWSSKTTTVTTKDLVRGSTTGVTIYNYIPMFPPQLNTGTSSQSVIPHENTVVYQDGSGNTLRTVKKVWLGVDLLGAECEILDNGIVSGKFYQYQQISGAYLWSDGSDQVTDLAEYDYTQGVTSACVQPPSTTAPARETKTQYATIPSSVLWQPYESAAIPQTNDRPSVIQVYDHGTLIAETDFAYDQTSVGSVSPTAYNHDETNFSPSQVAGRGNATTITKKCVTNCSTNSVITAQYDETGQIVGVTDANGNTTTLSYADNYSTGGTPPGNTNTYVTTITRPTTNGVKHISSFAYHYMFGELTSATDENSRVTTYQYNDTWGRPTLAAMPDGGQTEKAYNDSAPSPSVTTCQLINGTAGARCIATHPPTGWKTTLGTMDGVGQLVQTELVSDPDGPTFTATSYDGSGRAYQVYNPTRCSSITTNCDNETTWGLTTYTYDALGRTTNVAEPDGSAVTTSYSGNCTTVTDEAGKARQSCVDGLGRMTSVVEDPGSPVGHRHLDYTTNYAYDALNDLLTVSQQGGSTSSANWRPRSFTYDSLSRLVTATNPESGTTTYTYDPNGNVLTRVAPQANQTGTAQTTTTYSYDALNRLLHVAHSNPSNANASWAYDGSAISGCPGVSVPTLSSPTNLIGRRSAKCSQQSTSSFSYDPMGRLIAEAHSIGLTAPPPVTYNTGYTYSLDGSPQTLTYPSGDVVTYTVGGAGRAIQLNDSSNNYVGYSGSTATYAPQGALARMTNGYTSSPSGIVTLNSYNDRLQPILLSASNASSTIFSLCYDFHLHVAVSSCNLAAYTTGDNGNVFQILNNSDSTRSAAFTYDPLNRISQANTTNTTSSNCWGETYTVDGWGNLTNIGAPSGIGGSCFMESLNAAPASTANQLNGFCYDAAGNLLLNSPCPSGSFTPTYEYDAENRLYNPQAEYTYFYDADGVRIRKAASATVGTMYWPGANGEYLMETNGSGTINEEYIYFNGERIARVDRPSGTVHYYFSNHLGSASVITDDLGNIEQQTDYYPFGGVAYTSGSDTNHYKFTGKERDSESNLDMFGARYYGSSLGRFMTPDWAAKPTAVPYAHYGNPQSLNLYSYVQNNPTTIGDPDGHWPTFRLGGTWTHSDIVDAAYPGLSAAQRQIIKNGSAKADEDQSRAGAPAHGMTPKGEDKAIAMRDAAKIVANSESAARNDQAAYTAAGGKGIADSALSAVAPAFHEQTDETSPAYAGFQEWGGMGEGNAIQQLQEVAAGAEHAARESSATPEEKAASIAAAQRVLQSVLPPDLYQKAITPPKQQ